MMKLTTFILIVSSHLVADVHSGRKNNMPIRDCYYSHTGKKFVPKPYLDCTNNQRVFFPYRENYKETRSLIIDGSFSRFRISKKYSKLEHLQVYYGSPDVTVFSFQDYEKLNLRTVEIYPNNPTGLNLTGVEKQEYLQSFRMQTTNEISFVSCRGLNTLRKLKKLYIGLITTFDMSCLPTSVESLEFDFTGTRELISAQSLHSLTNLKNISIDFLDNLNFDFGNLPGGIVGIDIVAHDWPIPAMLLGCSRLRTKYQVKKIQVENYPAILTCLPPNITKLIVSYNDLTSLTEKSCASLRALSHLQYVDLSRNHLQTFDFTCLPDSVQVLDISYNELTDLNFRQLERFPNIVLYGRGNPFDCTCSFFRAWIRLNTSKGISQHTKSTYGACLDDRCCGEHCVTCSADSKLADYPWNSPLRELVKYDKLTTRCITN